ncbi:HigA family addiction module antitoxin [Orbaceae bacterium ac157xtp]
MKMYNPPHPGEVIKNLWLDELNIRIRQLAQSLNVAPSTIARLINGKADVSPEMAIRLSKVLGRTPQSWLAMQDNYSVWKLEQQKDFSQLSRLDCSHIAHAV